MSEWRADRTEPELEPEPLLARYLHDALARIDRGESVDPAEICADHPELRDELAAALEIAADVPRLCADAREHDPWLGKELLRRYRLDECIGAGAAGIVYRAQDLELDRAVAVKLLPRGLFPEERFLRESRILAALDHPNVLRIHDRGRSDEGVPFLVTELLCGATLATVIDWARDAMPGGPDAAAFARNDWLCERVGAAAAAAGEHSFLRLAVRWCADLAAGLAAGHQKDVFHRDVKPSNVFLTDDGRAILLDFGIAARLGDASLTTTGAAVGTPWYMAPEQVTGNTRPGPALDVYGLCATLYHLLTLRPPFGGGAAARVLADLQTRDPTPAHRLHRGLPRDLAGIVEKGMERDPRRRYRNALELEHDLRAFLDHRPVTARPIGPLRRAARSLLRTPARAVVVLAGGSAVALLVFGWREAAARERDAEYDRLLRTVPAQLAIEAPPDQKLVEALSAADRDYLDLLDRLLELRPDDRATRLLRAALALDAGERDRAAQDLAALARDAPSPYLDEVARRFADARDTQRGIEAVDLEGLPEPASEIDCFVAGFHALRAQQWATAEAFLDRAGDHPSARDLRLIALIGCRRFREAMEEAFHLEGQHGKTARTRHTVGVALMFDGRFEEALEPLEESLRLRPGRYGPLLNLGWAHLRLGRLPKARDYLEQACAVRPWLDNSKSLGAQVHAALGDWAEARSYAGEIGEPWWRLYELANIDLTEAVARWVEGDRTAAASAAGRAIDHFELSLQEPGHGKAGGARTSTEMARGIIAGDLSAVVTPYTMALVKDPRNPTGVMNLAVLIEDRELRGDEVTALRLFLLQLAIQLAPDDPRPKEHRDRLLEQLRRDAGAATQADPADATAGNESTDPRRRTPEDK